MDASPRRLPAAQPLRAATDNAPMSIPAPRRRRVRRGDERSYWRTLHPSTWRRSRTSQTLLHTCDRVGQGGATSKRGAPPLGPAGGRAISTPPRAPAPAGRGHPRGCTRSGWADPSRLTPAGTPRRGCSTRPVRCWPGDASATLRGRSRPRGRRGRWRSGSRSAARPTPPVPASSPAPWNAPWCCSRAAWSSRYPSTAGAGRLATPTPWRSPAATSPPRSSSPPTARSVPSSRWPRARRLSGDGTPLGVDAGLARSGPARIPACARSSPAMRRLRWSPARPGRPPHRTRWLCPSPGPRPSTAASPPHPGAPGTGRGRGVAAGRRRSAATEAAEAFTLVDRIHRAAAAAVPDVEVVGDPVHGSPTS